MYSQHSVTVLEVDEAGSEAVVEIGSLYGPLSGSGVRYRIEHENDGWRVISKQTMWVSRGRDGKTLV